MKLEQTINFIFLYNLHLILNSILNVQVHWKLRPRLWCVYESNLYNGRVLVIQGVLRQTFFLICELYLKKDINTWFFRTLLHTSVYTDDKRKNWTLNCTRLQSARTCVCIILYIIYICNSNYKIRARMYRKIRHNVNSHKKLKKIICVLFLL